MEFRKENGMFLSTDGMHNIYYSMFIPDEVKASVVIVHGMCEYKERYDDFSSFLASNGFSVLCYDQLGHGKSVNDESEKGWFGESDGVENLQGDVLKAVQLMKDTFYGKKVVLFGHSMGSFIVRYFAVNNSDKIDALVISGTNGGEKPVDLAIALSSFVARVNGSKFVNKLLDTLTMSGNNNRFAKNGETSPYAWISSDRAVQKQCEKDLFVFTAQGFCDMFKMLKYVSSSSWYSRFPKKLPTYLVSGEDDLVGNFGKGVISVYMKLKIKKVENVEIKLFPQCRHEPLNEINKTDVYSETLKWIENNI